VKYGARLSIGSLNAPGKIISMLPIVRIVLSAGRSEDGLISSDGGRQNAGTALKIRGYLWKSHSVMQATN